MRGTSQRCLHLHDQESRSGRDVSATGCRIGRKSFLLGLMLLLALSGPLISNVSAGPVTHIEIDQIPPITIDADSQMQFSATLYDASNSTVSGSIEWSTTNGTIDGAGLFTPWSAGNITITASSEAVSQFVNITVEPGWPASLSLLSNVSEVGLDSSVQLTAKLLDARANEVFGHTLL